MNTPIFLVLFVHCLSYQIRWQPVTVVLQHIQPHLTLSTTQAHLDWYEPPEHLAALMYVSLGTWMGSASYQSAHNHLSFSGLGHHHLSTTASSWLDSSLMTLLHVIQLLDHGFVANLGGWGWWWSQFWWWKVDKDERWGYCLDFWVPSLSRSPNRPYWYICISGVLQSTYALKPGTNAVETLGQVILFTYVMVTSCTK